MLAAVVRGKTLVMKQKSLPKTPPGWALVRVRLAGICNTDLEILRGYHNFKGTLGHEFVGEVVRAKPMERSAGEGNFDAEASRAAAQQWKGRRVVGEINIACAGLFGFAKCDACRAGIATHCAQRQVLGIVKHNGAFADYLTLPFCNLHAVPDEVSDEQAVFTEPLAAACRILEQVPVLAHRDVVVLGDGKLAQLIARVMATTGRNVVMLGKHDEKLALAREAGIRTQNVERGWEKIVRKHGHAFSLVIEATGSPQGFSQALELLQPRGVLVLKSTFHGTAKIQTWPLVVNEITVVGSRCGPFGPALELLRNGQVDPRPLISEVFPLREARAALAATRKPGVLKVLLKP
jgi:threonine dehydrogenase-like Zn-dependent dehydrogenase